MEIVRALKLTKGAFYHHFTGKEELFREVVHTYMIETGEGMYEALDQSSLQGFMYGYLERMHQAYLTMQQHSEGDTQTTINYFYLAFDALRVLEGFDQANQTLRASEHSLWETVIQHAKDAGEIKTDIPNAHLARLFVGVNDGVGMQLALQSRFQEAHAEIQVLWEDLYNLIKH